MHRHDAPADFIGDQNDPAGQLRQQVDQRAGLLVQQRAIDRFAGFGLSGGAAGKEQVGQPQGQAIDQDAGIRPSQFVQFVRQVQGFFGAAPVGRAAFAVMGDAGAISPSRASAVAR